METSDAAAWPYVTGGEPSMRLEWMTDGLPAIVGTETTLRIRKAPQVVLEFAGLEQGAAARDLEMALCFNGSKPWHAPIAFDVAYTTAATSAGASSIAVDTAGYRFRDAGVAILIADGRHELVAIETVGASALTLSAPLAQEWPAHSQIVPTVGARLSEAPALERFTVDSVSYSVGFRSIEPFDIEPEEGTLYLGHPVLEWPVDNVRVSHVRNPLSVDDGLAPPVVYDINNIPTPRVVVEVVAETRTQVASLLGLLYALCGRWRPIWVPTYAADLAVQSTSGSTVDVAPIGLADAGLVANRRDLRFRLRDGSFVYRRITGAAVVGDVERLTLNAAAPASSDILVASFMVLSRQDSDVNVLNFWRHDVALTQLAFAGCIHDV